MAMQPVHIQLLPSKLLVGLLGGVSIACCFVLMSLPILLSLKFVIIALIIASSAFFILRDALLILPNSWKTIDVDSKGELALTNKNGQKFQLKPASNSFIYAACSVLNFRRVGFNFALPPVILLSNAENADELRRFRVWLRWGKHEENQEDLTPDLAE